MNRPLTKTFKGVLADTPTVDRNCNTAPWISSSIMGLTNSLYSEQLIVKAWELLNKRRLVDFHLVPGRIIAKIQDLDDKTYRTELQIGTFSPRNWSAIFARLSEQSLYSAALLSGDLLPDFNEIIDQLELSLFPKEIMHTQFQCDCNRSKKPCVHAATLLLRLAEKLESEPFQLFTLRGCGLEETISELRKRRVQRQRLAPQTTSTTNNTPTGPTESDFNNYYTAPKQLYTLSYLLRADELPSSILRSLEPLPGVEISPIVELNIENAYNNMTSRAQAYALGINPTRPPSGA